MDAEDLEDDLRSHEMITDAAANNANSGEKKPNAKALKSLVRVVSRSTYA